MGAVDAPGGPPGPGELIASRTFEGGLQLREHVPAHLAAPPGTAWER